MTDPAERARLLSFAVVGGGPNWVEFGGELAELVAGALTRDFPNLRRSEISITLADASSHPLSAFPQPFPAAAHRALERKGVGVRTGVRVDEVDKTGLQLSDGTAIPAAVVVWAAGVRASGSLGEEGAIGASSLEDLVAKLARPRAAWVIVPPGEVTDKTVRGLAARMEPNDVIIDGGTSTTGMTSPGPGFCPPPASAIST